MKLLVAHKYFYRGGGTATYVFALVEELEARGHQCVPFTVAYQQTEVDSYSEYFVSPPLGAEQTHLNDMTLSPWAMLKLLGRATYSFEARTKAMRLIDATKPDIAYLQNIYNYMSPSIIDACRKRGLPVVMRVPDFNLMCAELHFLCNGRVCTECLEHGYKRALRYRCLKGSLAATAARVASMYVHKWLHIYDKVDLFITPSSFQREMMISGGYDADKIVHLPSFYPGQVDSGEQSAEDDYILYFGRLAPEKGIDTLIRAMAMVNNDVRLVIAGADVDGTRASLEQLVEDVALNNVEFVGFQERSALDELIRRCLFTVMPSRCYDNCPMGTLESFAYNKPVVGSNIGGIPEQIADGCGLLFEPDNPQDLAKQMQLLLDRPELRRQMGRAAGERVATHYAPKAHCDRLLNLFRELIEVSHG